MNIVRFLSLKSMKKNKTTTVVTVLGIIMSLALMTGLFLFSNSLIDFLHQDISLEQGDSHFILPAISRDDLAALPNRDLFESETKLSIMGVELFESDTDQPFYRVFGMTPERLAKAVPLRVLAGRMPEKVGEALISEDVNSRREVMLKLGDTVTLDLYQGEAYIPMGESLDFEEAQSKPTVTIVGVSNNPMNYPMGGAAIFVYQTEEEIAAASHFWSGIRIEDITTAKVKQFEKGLNHQKYWVTQTNLVEMEPKVQSPTRVIVMTFAMVLVVIAAVAGISLIQNGFLISLSQRIRELSVLSSVGMTRRQKWYMSLTEGVLLYLIGLPIGLASGFLAMAILFRVLTPILQRMVHTTAQMRLVWDVSTLFFIVLAGFITVLIATIIPAIRTSKQTPLAGVRQHDTLNIKADKLKTPWYVRLFGLEGEIAWKNLRRNRRSYRGTLISLVLSLVLYLSLASLISYTDYSADVFLSTGRDDVQIFNYSTDSFLERDKLESIIELDGVESGLAYYTLHGQPAKETEQMDPTLLEQGIPGVHLVSFDDETMDKLLSDWGITRADLQGQKGVLINQYRDRKDKGVFSESKIFTSPVTQMNLAFYTEKEEEPKIPLEIIHTVQTSELPYELWGPVVRIVVASETIEELIKQYHIPSISMNLNLRSDQAKHDELIDAIFVKMQTEGIAGHINDTREAYQSQRDFILIGKILFFGFATILALISLTNIYNTIISSLRFRRKEFAMLRSVGMEEKSFRRMIRFESYFYAFKLLLFGIPLGILSSWLIHQRIIGVTEFGFRIPLAHFALASLVIVAILIIIMNLGSIEARRGNILDTLKRDMDF